MLPTLISRRVAGRTSPIHASSAAWAQAGESPCAERAASSLQIGSAVVALIVAVAWGGPVGAAEPRLDFNRDIRPILAENCFYCHGQDANKRQGDLRLDEREAAVTVGALVPGAPEQSSLIARIEATDPNTQMPPPKSNRRLTAEQKATLRRWIQEGAVYQPHWAFVAPVRPAEPAVQRGAWVRNPIDRFVLAKLEAEGLSPAPEADRATLIRRLHADLVGLPPSPEEVDRFVSDRDPQAYEHLVDRLLASPHYGERLALPWLDAARYADSNGFQQDGDTWQWLWRDWVVKALNEDLSFDKFTIWQLAGDLLPDATTEQKIASGFNRNHLLNGEGGAIAEEQRWVILFDRMETTAMNWLGLTATCAQCHDHKFDPLTTRDYYSLLDGFNRLPESGVPSYYSPRIRVAPPILELPPAPEHQAKIDAMQAEINAYYESHAKIAYESSYQGWRSAINPEGNAVTSIAGLGEPAATLLKKPNGERTDEERQTLEAELRKHFESKVRDSLAPKVPEIAKMVSFYQNLNAYKADVIPRPMIMSDASPRETHILSRGEYLQPGEKVTFNTPAFLPPLPANAPRNRLGLAEWLVAPEQPLTARVQVNRMWQYFFGQGIVRTAEDFGVQSEFPTHGPLLDWLAVQFRESGWSMKGMHRLMVTSATYRQSSKVSPELLQRDPQNKLFARGGRFRLPSMVLRDWALSAAGLLDTRLGGRPVYPYQPDAVWESLAITYERDFTYPKSAGSDLYRRSLYTFWRRTVGPVNMFDASARQSCRVRLTVNNTPLHALTTLNDPTWVEAARVLAERSARVTQDTNGQLRFAWRQVLSREPRESELATIRRLHDKQLAIYEQDRPAAEKVLTVGATPRDATLDPVRQAALATTCLGIMNLDEALTHE